MPIDVKKLLAGGASGALQAAPTGNTAAIVGNAALQAVLGGLSGRQKFDPGPLLGNFQRYKQDVLADIPALASESVSQVNQDYAARGLGGSPLVAGIAKGTETALTASALRQLRGQEYDLRQQIAGGVLQDDLNESAENRELISGLIGQVGGFASDVFSGDPNASPGVKKIAEILGIEEREDPDALYSAKLLEYLKGGGTNANEIPDNKIPVGKKGKALNPSSPFGAAYTESESAFEEIGKELVGGLDEILDAFGSDNDFIT